MMLVASSFLSDYPAHCIRAISSFLCVLGQLLAWGNAAAIIVTCLLQFGNFYDQCYCNSVVLMLGSRAYDIFWVRNVGDIKRPWVGGVALGVGSAVLFLITIWVSLPASSIPARPQGPINNHPDTQLHPRTTVADNGPIDNCPDTQLHCRTMVADNGPIDNRPDTQLVHSRTMVADNGPIDSRPDTQLDPCTTIADNGPIDNRPDTQLHSRTTVAENGPIDRGSDIELQPMHPAN